MYKKLLATLDLFPSFHPQTYFCQLAIGTAPQIQRTPEWLAQILEMEPAEFINQYHNSTAQKDKYAVQLICCILVRFELRDKNQRSSQKQPKQLSGCYNFTQLLNLNIDPVIIAEQLKMFSFYPEFKHYGTYYPVDITEPFVRNYVQTNTNLSSILNGMIKLIPVLSNEQFQLTLMQNHLQIDKNVQIDRKARPLDLVITSSEAGLIATRGNQRLQAKSAKRTVQTELIKYPSGAVDIDEIEDKYRVILFINQTIQCQQLKTRLLVATKFPQRVFPQLVNNHKSLYLGLSNIKFGGIGIGNPLQNKQTLSVKYLVKFDLKNAYQLVDHSKLKQTKAFKYHWDSFSSESKDIIQNIFEKRYLYTINDNHYRQTNGLPVGIHESNLLFLIYMIDFIERFIKQFVVKTAFNIYVFSDDVLITMGVDLSAEIMKALSNVINKKYIDKLVINESCQFTGCSIIVT